jgi:DNA-binding NarL/FixJ family response regulator
MEPIRVLVVDNDAWARWAFRNMLEPEPDIEVVGEAEEGAQALRLVRDLAPDVVVMDVEMPGMDGIEATRRITAGGPNVKVIVATGFQNDEYLFEALAAGASGFLMKEAEPHEVVRTLRSAASGDVLLSAATVHRLARRFRAPPRPGSFQKDPLAALTRREREVFFLVVKGLSNEEVGGRLFTGVEAVRSHVQHIYNTLGVHGRVQLVIWAYENRVVVPEPEKR